MQFRARPRGGGRESARKTQGLKAEADGVMQRAELLGGIVICFGHLPARDHAGGDAETLEGVAFRFEFGVARGRMRDMERALALRLEGDPFVRCKVAHEIDGLDLRGDEALRLREAIAQNDRAEREAGGGKRAEAAIAAGCAPAERPRFEQAYIGGCVAGEVISGGEAGIAAADDGGVAGFIRVGAEIGVGRKRRRVVFPEARDGPVHIVDSGVIPGQRGLPEG